MQKILPLILLFPPELGFAILIIVIVCIVIAGVILLTLQLIGKQLEKSFAGRIFLASLALGFSILLIYSGGGGRVYGVILLILAIIWLGLEIYGRKKPKT